MRHDYRSEDLAQRDSLNPARVLDGFFGEAVGAGNIPAFSAFSASRTLDRVAHKAELS